MGYQYAVVTLSTGGIETGYIFNGRAFAKKEDVRAMSVREVSDEVSRAGSGGSGIYIKDINLIPRSLESLRGIRRIHLAAFNKAASTLTLANCRTALSMSESARAGGAAKDAPDTVTLAGEVFMRFSAYADDFRITPGRGLKAGTFATTAEDAAHVKTGREAVSRYALENKQSANKRFTIKPPADTKIKNGTVQPAYGETGGGVEVIFVDGAPDGTVTLPPHILPEE